MGEFPMLQRAKKESVKSQKYGQVQNAAICKVAKCKQRKKNGNFAMLAQVVVDRFSHRQTFVTLHFQITTRGRIFRIKILKVHV